MTTPKHAETPCSALDLESDPKTESFEELIASSKAASLATNTRKTYDSGWRSWSRWASDRGHPVLPADPEHLQVWLATMVIQNMKPTTAAIYLAAVADRHRALPGPNPAHDPQVRRLLAGLSRTSVAKGNTPRQASPLRWKDIERIVDTAHIPRNNQPGGSIETPEQAQQRALTDIAMIALAHDAALRCSELLAIRWADIEAPEENGLNVVRIRWSKTDQTGQGAIAVMSDFTAQAIARIKPDGAHPHDRIFAISPSTVTRRMRAAAEAAGIDATDITSHSPRVGMAQDLAASGISIAGLMGAGRWKSAATAIRYTERVSASDTPVGRYLKTQRYRNPLKTVA